MAQFDLPKLIPYPSGKAVSPLISHSGGSDCVMLWSPGGEGRPRHIQGDMVREDESAGGQIISKMSRQSGGVEEWRGGDVCAAPFPLPAHQTGRADFPHPASGPR